MDGQSAEGWYQRGLLYESFGQFEGALSDFETAATRNRHHMNALLRIAAIHHNNENWDNAISAWRNVLDVEPDHRVARRRIQDAIDGQSSLKKAAILSNNGMLTEELETVVEAEVEVITTEELETVVEAEVEVIATEELEITPQEVKVEQVIDKPRGGPEDWVDAIDAYINQHGGVVNQDFRNLGLIPEDVTSSERARMNEELADCFTKHKVTNFRVFYCDPSIIEPDEVQAQYDKCQNHNAEVPDKTSDDKDIPDFEFGFGTL